MVDSDLMGRMLALVLAFILAGNILGTIHLQRALGAAESDTTKGTISTELFK